MKSTNMNALGGFALLACILAPILVGALLAMTIPTTVPYYEWIVPGCIVLSLAFVFGWAIWPKPSGGQ